MDNDKKQKSENAGSGVEIMEKIERVQKYLAEQWLLAAECDIAHFYWYLDAIDFYNKILKTE